MTIITSEIKEFDKKVISLAAAYRSRATPNNLFPIQQKILLKEQTLEQSSLEEIEKIGILGFSYNYRLRTYENKINALKKLILPSGPLKKLYKDKIQESILKLRMLESLGTDEFTKKSEELYGYPSKELIDKAYDILDLSPSPKGDQFSTQKAKRLLRKKLSALNLKWSIRTKKLLGYALITPAKQTVTLSSNHQFTEATIDRLAVHEVGTHGIRYLNAKLQPLGIFKNFPGYLSTEEGLAAFTEEITGYLNNDTLRRYAGRVIAVDYAQNHTLLETYFYLKKFFDDSNALHIAMRIKRGLPNSESQGAYTKDHVYLKGFFNIKNYVRKNPLRFLYYGKVSLEYTKLLKKLEPELSPVKYYPPLLINYEKKSEVLEKN